MMRRNFEVLIFLLDSFSTDFIISFILGIRLIKSISDKNRTKYFEIILNGKQYYLHKQAATWHLQNKQSRLSCDRLRRVQGKDDSW